MEIHNKNSVYPEPAVDLGQVGQVISINTEILDIYSEFFQFNNPKLHQILQTYDCGILYKTLNNLRRIFLIAKDQS